MIEMVPFSYDAARATMVLLGGSGFLVGNGLEVGVGPAVGGDAPIGEVLPVGAGPPVGGDVDWIGFVGRVGLGRVGIGRVGRVCQSGWYDIFAGAAYPLLMLSAHLVSKCCPK